MTREQLHKVLEEIDYELKKHPGDAPWSCLDCYHGRFCKDREILLAAKAHLSVTEEGG